MLPLEDYYFLLHAFDLIGHRLYPEWTGDEFDQCPVDPPELVTAARAPIESEISALNDEEAGLRAEMGRITDDARIKKHKVRISEIAKERTRRQHDLLGMRKIDPAYERDYAAHQRRVRAEGMGRVPRSGVGAVGK